MKHNKTKWTEWNETIGTLYYCWVTDLAGQDVEEFDGLTSYTREAAEKEAEQIRREHPSYTVTVMEEPIQTVHIII